MWFLRRPRRPICKTPTVAQRAILKVEQLEDRALPSVTIRFNYDYDTNNFFNTEEKREWLQLVGDLVGSRLDDRLKAIVPTGSYSNEEAGKTGWLPRFTHPGTGQEKFTGNNGELDQFVVQENEIVVFVGSRFLEGSTIGKGGPGGREGTWGGDLWKQLVYERGQPGAHPSDGKAATETSLWGGSISFDSDPSIAWYFGPGATPSGQTNFMAAATHELGHVLGLIMGDDKNATGADDDPKSWIDGNTFIGASAKALYGGKPIPLDGSHFAQIAAKDPRLPNGTPVMMTPTVNSDIRHYSAIDWAAFDDIGWDVSPDSKQLVVKFTGPTAGEYHGVKIETLTDSGKVLSAKPYNVANFEVFNFYRLVGTPGGLFDVHFRVSIFGSAFGSNNKDPGAAIATHYVTFTSAPVEVKFVEQFVDQNVDAGNLGFGFGHPMVGYNLFSGGATYQVGEAPPATPLQFAGHSTSDTYTLYRSATNTANLYAKINASTWVQALSTITAIHVDPQAGGDTLTLDFTNGMPMPAGGVIYNGGTGADSLIIKKGKFSNVVYTHSGNSGSLILNGVPVTFTDIDALNLQFSTTNLTVRSRRLMAGIGISVTGQLTLEGGSTLGGEGVISAKVEARTGSKVVPGSGTGNDKGIIETKSLTMRKGSTFAVDFDAGGIGVPYDRVNVTGSVVLQNPTLFIDVGPPAPPPGTKLIILSNDGKDPIQGTFLGLPEGAQFIQDGYKFSITYKGGDGNDIAITTLNITPPDFKELRVSTSSITTAGTDIVTIQAANFNAGNVNGVEFWLDLNKNGQIDNTTVDRLLRDHQSTTGPYEWTGVITGVGAGDYKLFGRPYVYAPGGTQYYGNVVPATIHVTASPPVEQHVVKLGTELRANGATGDSRYGAIVRMDAQGNQGIFWRDVSYSLWYKRYDTAGNVLVGSVNLLNNVYNVDDVAMFDDGSFYILTEGTDLRMTGFNAAGVATGFAQQIDSATYRAGSARISATSPLTFAIAWERGNYYQSEIYLRRFTDGVFVMHGRVSAAKASNPSTGPTSTSPAVALDKAGNVMVVWNTFTTASTLLKGRIYLPNGNAAGDEFKINASGETISYSDDQNAIAAMRDGGFTVAYTSTRSGTGTDVVLRRYGAGGTFVKSAVANSYLGGTQSLPRIAAVPVPDHDGHDGAGADRFVVTWTSYDQEVGQNGAGTYAQIFNADLTKYGGEFLVNTTTAGAQSAKGIALHADGYFAIGWEGDGQGDTGGILSQRFRFNDAPTEIQLLTFGQYVDETTPVGMILSSVRVRDPNPGETFTRQLVTGPGLDSAAFTISGNSLRTATNFDYETKPIYHIRIRATDAGGLSIEQDFFIRVKQTVQGLAGKTRSAKFTDSDGDVYTISLVGPGSFNVGLDDTDGDGKGSIGQLDVLDADPQKSSLAISVVKGKNGDGVVTLDEIDVRGGLKSLSMPMVDVFGGGIVRNVTSLRMRDLKAGAILFHSSGVPNQTATFRIIEANTQFNFADLTKLTAARIDNGWIQGNSLGTLSVTGNSIQKIRGDFRADLTMDGPTDPTKPTLKTVSIVGDLDGGVWTIGGQVGTITVGGTVRNTAITIDKLGSSSPNLLDGSLGTISVGRVFGLNLDVERSITTINAKGWFSGNLIADSLGRLSNSGDFSGSIDLRGDHVLPTKYTLSMVSITGITMNSQFYIGGNVGTFATSKFYDSILWVGFTPINGAVNPIVNPGAFTLEPFKIASFKTTSTVDSFRGGSVVADRIDTISIRSLPVTDQPELFGIALDTTYTTFILGTKTVGRNGVSYQKGSFRLKSV